MKLKQTLIALGSSTLLLASPLTLAKTSVWKISKGDDYIYLGGTVHIMPKSELPLPKAFDLAYQDSDAIVLEADLPAEDDIQAQMQMMQKMSYGNGKTLNSVLDKATYQALGQFFAELGVNIEMFNGFKPGLVTTMMAVMAAKKANMGDKGVDDYFDKLTAKDGKQAEYLESADFQVEMLASLGEGSENTFVQGSLKQMHDFVPMMKALLKAWRQGDVNTINRLVNQPVLTDDPQTYKIIFTQRNNNWLSKLERLFGDKDTEFVLVGMGHLVGQDNVLTLLKQQGYSIKQL